jgi:mono/diheme cytochrome c family protein
VSIRRLLPVPLAAALIAVAGCGGGDETAATTQTITVETETTTGSTEAGTSTEGETDTEGATATTTADESGNVQAGAKVFASAGCGGCHTLAAAGSTGNVGPNLDDRKPSFDKVVERVTEGKPPMPSFKGQLTEQQINDVAAYVSSSTRGS